MSVVAFLQQARKILAGHPKANVHTMRGFAGKPDLPTYQEVYGLKAAAMKVVMKRAGAGVPTACWSSSSSGIPARSSDPGW